MLRYKRLNMSFTSIISNVMLLIIDIKDIRSHLLRRCFFVILCWNRQKYCVFVKENKYILESKVIPQIEINTSQF